MEKQKSYKIVLIGAGNVAHHLSQRIINTDNQLLQIYNRTLNHIDVPNSISITNDVNNIRKDADIYIISVSDDAIPSIVKNLHLADKLIVHTSGNKSMDILIGSSKNYGVLYPFQSFNKNVPLDFQNVPLLIEANNEPSKDLLVNFSNTLSSKVLLMNEVHRKRVNLAGVMVNNFTNHLFTLAYDFLKTSDIDFEVLKPLIQNTIDKLYHDNPKNLQTGPAVRNDTKTIRSQQEILSPYPELLDIYNQMTNSILDYQKKK